MNIIIKSLTIINFKGIAKLTIPFNAVTNVYGANASGKTTIFDAFTFLLFGKDSGDRKDFEVKPLDAAGKSADRTENVVSAILSVDGEEISLRHAMKEKWVKKRGEDTSEFTGNEHLYFWNDVPLQAGEYQAKVNAILPEHVFKLLTNPIYFNSIKWQDRRAILQEIAGEVTDDELVAGNPDFAKLLEQLSGKSLNEFRAKNAVEKKRLKEELAMVPARLDELERTKPEIVDEAEVQAEIDSLQSQYDALDKQIEDRNEAQKAENEAIRALNERRHNLESVNQQIRARHTQEHGNDVVKAGAASNELTAAIERRKTTLEGLNDSLKRQKQQLTSLDDSHKSHVARIDRNKAEIGERVASLRKLFEATNAREINPNSLVCSECGREHEAHDIEAIRTNFNTNKVAELQSIKTQGDALKADIAKLDTELETATSQYETTKKALEKTIADLETQVTAESLAIGNLESELASVKADDVEVTPVADRLQADTGYLNNMKEIAEIDTALQNRKGVDLGDLRTKKALVNADLDAAKRKLMAKDQTKAIDKRITELKEQEKAMAQQLAAIEREEFVAESYEKAKSEELERRVNSMFRYARFKLFNQLINGGEEPTCITTYQGVPFPDLNNAAKVMIGIDIISTLSAHYGVTAPIWIDNRESITSIPDTAAQLINLIVSPDDQSLRVA